MPRLTVSNADATAQILNIPHKTIGRAFNRYWNVSTDGHVNAQSVCWLFCWGKTGINSDAAASVARNVFDAIFDISFNRFDSLVNHEWARINRKPSAIIDDELEAILRGA